MAVLTCQIWMGLHCTYVCRAVVWLLFKGVSGGWLAFRRWTWGSYISLLHP